MQVKYINYHNIESLVEIPKYPPNSTSQLLTDDPSYDAKYKHFLEK